MYSSLVRFYFNNRYNRLAKHHPLVLVLFLYHGSMIIPREIFNVVLFHLVYTNPEPANSDR